MDNHSAICYLTTCKHRYALYHSFPLTEPVSWFQLSNVSDIRERVDPSYYPSQERSHPRRVDCCTDVTRAGRYIGRMQPIPRIIRVKGRCHGSALAYLQHAEELDVHDQAGEPVTKYTLPRTLRKLYIALLQRQVVNVNWLPPGLTALAMTGGTESLLRPGVLPQSLLTLVLQLTGGAYGALAYDQVSQPAVVGVLPSQLQRLVIQWNRLLADITLPASLTRLDLYALPDLPIPAGYLPVGLRTLRISTTSFNPRHLIGALPSSLRALHLYCMLTQPLTADLFASTPLLEELDLGNRFSYSLDAGALVPLTSLHVLRFGLKYWRPVPVSELPASLRRLVVVTPTAARPTLNELAPNAALGATLVVKYEFEPYPITHNMDAETIFAELYPA